MPMTDIQEVNQTWGPMRPTIFELKLILDIIPKHYGVVSIALNGQTGKINVETRHEDAESIFTFERIGLAGHSLVNVQRSKT